jgi:hypothetical protein
MGVDARVLSQHLTMNYPMFRQAAERSTQPTLAWDEHLSNDVQQPNLHQDPLWGYGFSSPPVATLLASNDVPVGQPIHLNNAFDISPLAIAPSETSMNCWGVQDSPKPVFEQEFGQKG